MTDFDARYGSSSLRTRSWTLVAKCGASWIVLLFGLLGCEWEPQRTVELPKGMRRMGNANMSRPTGLAGGGADIMQVISFRWSVQPKNGQLNECASRYSEAMFDMLSVSDPRRLNQLLIDAGYQVGDLEAEFGTKRFNADRKLISEIYWEQACAFASLGHYEDAIEALHRSIDRGMIDADRIRNSTLLAELRRSQDMGPVLKHCELAFQEQFHQIIAEAWVTQPLYLASEFQDLDGNPFQFGSGDQEFTVIFCWGTWSRPSMEMLPFMNRIAKDLQTQGVRLIGVLSEPAHSAKPESLRLMLRKQRTEFQNWIEDLSAAQQSSFSNLLMPAIVLVDARAQILAKLEGYQSPAVIETLLSRLADPSNVSQY